MADLYPNLHERFRSENICPICLIEMQGTPKYSCINNHTMCHRCKPYYYSCPTCRSPLEMTVPAQQFENYQPPPAIHIMPHPYPPYPPSNSQPSAPFLDQERFNWSPSPPTEDQELHSCQYSHYGCFTKVPEHLRSLHETRCQFRPHLEDDRRPTDLNNGEGPLENCKYSIVGCNVRLTEWRKQVHEEICIYKDKLVESDNLPQHFESLNFNDDYEDPEMMVDCRFRNHGCMVRMPRRRKHMHEEKCNYRKYNDSDDEEVVRYDSEPELDQDEQLPCRWSDFGCQVQPKRFRKGIHEEKCNYRREHCRFSEYGCSEMVEPPRRFIHEQRCQFAN